MKYILFIIIFLSVPTHCAFSQTDSTEVSTDELKGQNVIVYMSGGDEFRGVYLKKDDKYVYLETENGEVKLILTKVESIVRDEYTGKFKYPNPHETRYFFGPNAIPIRKGVGYYQNLMITTNFVNYGITRNFSIGGGLEFISTVTGNPIFFLTPKIGFSPTKTLHAGGGVFMVGLPLDGEINLATLAYGVITLGHAESNVTMGLGYGTDGNGFSNSPTVMISGQHRVSNGVSLMSENYLIGTTTSSFYTGIHGIRLIARNNAFDIGAIIIPEIAQFIPALPYIGYARVFGREKPRKK